MNIETIKRRIIHCIHKIYERDSDLFKRNNYEVTISTKLAQYLLIEFPEYDVDCEYNKHICGEKKVLELNQNIRPDIVIHRRERDDKNLVYIEIKKAQNNQSRELDYAKIKAVTTQKGMYKYKVGLFIDFSINEAKIQYFI